MIAPKTNVITHLVVETEVSVIFSLILSNYIKNSRQEKTPLVVTGGVFVLSKSCCIPHKNYIRLFAIYRPRPAYPQQPCQTPQLIHRKCTFLRSTYLLCKKCFQCFLRSSALIFPSSRLSLSLSLSYYTQYTTTVYTCKH